MNARYNSSDNTLKEISQMAEPVRPNQRDYDQVSLGGLIYDADLKKYFLDSDKYNDHIASLRTLPCHPSCKTVWKEGDVLWEYVHYVVRDESTVSNNEDGIQTKNAPAYVASPLAPVKSEDAELKDYIDTILSAYIDQQGRELAVESLLISLKQRFTITRKQ